MAAGSGQRMGGGQAKQYADLCGKSMLRRSIEIMLACPRIGQVRVVIGDGQVEDYARATAGLDLPPPVTGGATRQASVLAGLEALAAEASSPSHVLVHDAARPLASQALIERVVDALGEADAVLPVVPVVDTLKSRDERGMATSEVARDGLVRAQTPQGFRFPTLLAAHRRHRGRTLTDDAGVVAMDGVEVLTVEGEEENFKVTEPADLARAERLLAAAPRRWLSATGFDVHAFAVGRPLVLCGVPVPHERGLAGHSDADVAVHALTDALLGLAAAGDIGSHFPPTDERWRGADSAVFLGHALQVLQSRGGRLEHVDLTIIGERPKIGPHREAMRHHLSKLLGLGLASISLKATTTERLGFCGREEGLAAQATATASFPA